MQRNALWREKKAGQSLQMSGGMWEIGHIRSEGRSAMPRPPPRSTAFIPPRPSPWPWGMVGAERTVARCETLWFSVKLLGHLSFPPLFSSLWGIKDDSRTSLDCNWNPWNTCRDLTEPWQHGKDEGSLEGLFHVHQGCIWTPPSSGNDLEIVLMCQ